MLGLSDYSPSNTRPPSAQKWKSSLEGPFREAAARLPESPVLEDLVSPSREDQAFAGADPGWNEEDFQELLRQGKLTHDHILEARRRLGWHQTHRVLLPGLTQTALEHAMLAHNGPAIEPALRDWVLGLPWADSAEILPADKDPLTLVETVTGLSFAPAFASVWIPLCSSWANLPDKDGAKQSGFWKWFLEKISSRDYSAQLGTAAAEEANRLSSAGTEPGPAILELTGLSLQDAGKIREASARALNRTPGWAKSFAAKCQHPWQLADYIAAALFVEFHVARDAALVRDMVKSRELANPSTLTNALAQILNPASKTLELRREPWDLCLALLELGYSSQLLAAIDVTKTKKDLVLAVLGFGVWRRLSLWREAMRAALDIGSPTLTVSPPPAPPPPLVREKNPLPDPVASWSPDNHTSTAFPATGSLRILLVEDDLSIGKAVAFGLEERGHSCTWEKDGKKGLEQALCHQHDVVILDLMLPGVTGLELLKNMRAKGIKTPVVILTALSAVEERVAGLREGADDYLVKPFAFHELLARCEAVKRRSAIRPAPELRVGKLHLDLTNRKVTWDKQTIELTPTGFSLLEILMRNAGHVVTRKMLCEHLWEWEWEGVTNVIEVHINRLRNKLAQSGAEGIIQTVRGRGYTLMAVI